MRRRRCNAGFSAAELSLCFLTIATLSALVWGFGESCRERSRAIACASNLRQISLSIRMYIADNGGRGPIGDAPSSLMPYVKNEQVFACPSDRSRTPTDTPPPGDQAQRPGLSAGFHSSYTFATGVRDDGMPQSPIVQDDSPDAHLHDTFQLGRLDGSVRTAPADRWYPLQ